MRQRNPEPVRCSWCDQRCQDHRELAQHAAQHRREDEKAEEAARKIEAFTQERKAA